LRLNHTSVRTVQPQYAHTRESRNHTFTEFATFVHVVCDTVCTKFCSQRTMFDKVIVKTKNADGPKFADARTAAVSPYFKRSMVYVT